MVVVGVLAVLVAAGAILTGRDGSSADTVPVAEPVPGDALSGPGATTSVYEPPGGAGGYSGTVTAVDQPNGDDYVFFELYND